MSCTVVAVPILLYQAVVGIVTAAGITAAAASSINKKFDNTINYTVKDFNNITNLDNVCEDVHTFTVDNLVEKDFETPFMDKEVLLKTMEEHGITDIEENYDGKISGRLDTFGFLFEKPSQELPYHVKITCNKQDNVEEKVSDLSSEYALNVQEAAYLSIVEKLKDNNMEIENEEVEEDNTIVLTVNLE